MAPLKELPVAWTTDEPGFIQAVPVTAVEVIELGALQGPARAAQRRRHFQERIAPGNAAPTARYYPGHHGGRRACKLASGHKRTILPRGGEKFSAQPRTPASIMRLLKSGSIEEHLASTKILSGTIESQGALRFYAARDAV